MTVMRDFEAYGWHDVVPPDLLAIYAPYKRVRKIPERAALVILHPAAGMSLNVQPGWAVAIGRILAQSRKMSLPVIHSAEPESPFVPGVERHGDDGIVRRPCDSAFMFSDLPAVLKRRGARGLILCGATTSGSVRATAVEAKSYGYKAAIAEEATADQASLLHKMALFDMAHKYADVMSVDEMLGLMDGVRWDSLEDKSR